MGRRYRRIYERVLVVSGEMRGGEGVVCMRETWERGKRLEEVCWA